MTVSKSGTGNNSICLPFESEEHYQICMKDRESFVKFLNQNLEIHPELFPQAISEGFKLNGFVQSKKQKGFVSVALN
jgi:hypothetical protein